MAQVIAINRNQSEGPVFRAKHLPADRMFFICPCFPEEGDSTGLLPFVQMNEDAEPVLLALVCPGCLKEHPVVDGRLRPPRATG